MPINVKKKQIVTPGEVLAEGDYAIGYNTQRKGKTISATKIGLAEIGENRISVVGLSGCYIPAVDDQVIGQVEGIGLFGWQIDIDAPYSATLQASEAVDRRQEGTKQDLSTILAMGDLIIAKILAFDRTRDPLLSIKGKGLGRITSGRIVRISPAKVPRLIGRKGSMIHMIKKEADCQIIVGQNGRILVSSGSPIKEQAAIVAICKIEQEAHLEGLTDRVREMIRSDKKYDKTGDK